jgi:hypothetical protein
MADTERRSRGQPRKGKQVELAIGRIDTLIATYERRFRVNPDDVIAGSSRILLQNLLQEVQRYLPPGAIYDVIEERLFNLDAADPTFRCRVADELDLLAQIKQEFASQLSPGGAPSSRSAKPPRGKPPQSGWAGGPEGSEPHRNRRTPQPLAPEIVPHGCAVFPQGT